MSMRLQHTHNYALVWLATCAIEFTCVHAIELTFFACMDCRMPSGSTSKKRPNSHDLLVDAPTLSLRTISKVTNKRLKKVVKELDEYRHIWTPYNYFVLDMDIILEDGLTYRWSYINPFAMLYLYCQNATYFGFAVKYLVGRLASICLYVDDTNPGDPLHPDMTRCVCVVCVVRVFCVCACFLCCVCCVWCVYILHIYISQSGNCAVLLDFRRISKLVPQ